MFHFSFLTESNYKNFLLKERLFAKKKKDNLILQTRENMNNLKIIKDKYKIYHRTIGEKLEKYNNNTNKHPEFTIKRKRKIHTLHVSWSRPTSSSSTR